MMKHGAADEKLINKFAAILTRARLPLSSAFLNFLLMLPQNPPDAQR